MDKRMMLLGKIGTILADFIGIVVMLMALAFAFARENPLLFVVVATVVCPLWYKVVKKHWLSERPVVSALVRGVILIGGYLLLTMAIRWNPYNRCYNSVAKETFQQRFDELNKEEGYTFEEVGDINKKEMWDYLKLTASVSYRDTEGVSGKQEIVLYFDRLDGRYYEDFAAMREYRVEYRKKYATNSFRNRLFFDEEQLDAKVEEINSCLVSGEHEEIKKQMDTELREKVTDEAWKGWSDVFASRGEYVGQEMPAEKNWSVTEDEEHVQTMEVKETLGFASGKVGVRMVFHDDLTLQVLEVNP